MIVFHISKELQKRYQNSIAVGTEIPEDETGFPFENWYVRKRIVSSSEFTLFLEKERNIIVWAKGVRSENIEEVFKERFLDTVLRAGIPYSKAADLRIAEQQFPNFFLERIKKNWKTDTGRGLTLI